MEPLQPLFFLLQNGEFTAKKNIIAKWQKFVEKKENRKKIINKEIGGKNTPLVVCPLMIFFQFFNVITLAFNHKKI